MGVTAAVVALLGCDRRAPAPAPVVHQVAVTPSEAAPQARPEPPDVTVTLEQLTAPYFAGGAADVAARHFAAGEWEQARDGFAAYLAAGRPTTGEDTARVKLLIAMCDARLRRWDAAARGFDDAAGHLPPLANFIRYQAARSHLFAGDPDRALEVADSVTPTSRRRMDAILLIGDVLRQAERWEDVIAHYERYLDDYPEGIRLSEARYQQARALERVGRAIPDAVDLYRRITVADPRSAWARHARKRIQAILRRQPRRTARRHRALAAGDYIERGLVHYRAKRHGNAAKEFEKALDAQKQSAEDACVASYYLADSWFRNRNRNKSAALFDEATARCEDARVVDLEVKSAYRGGRSFAILGDWGKAADRFARAERVAATNAHSYADDARVFRAEAVEKLGERDEAVALLEDVPQLYPAGDMRAEAVWRLAWTAYLDGDYPAAIGWLERQLATESVGSDRKPHRRAQYWIGRAYGRLGDIDAAVAAYAATVRDYPLSYYALMASNRLREHDPTELRRVLDEVAPKSVPAKSPDELRFRPRLIESDPNSARLFELYRLGLDGRAQAELMRRGLHRPAPGVRKQPAEIEAMWAVALLHHRAGRHSRAVWITRWHAIDYKRAWPVGENRAKWEIAYPPAFLELIQATAESYGYPTALQMAIVREESGFDPAIESWANAIGLGQLILPTARHFGKLVGIRATRRNLRDPETNLAIAGRFLSVLWDKSDGNVALIPPCYNAGEGAVARWLERRGDYAVDEWIEAIPSDQTRGYSKRVLGAYFAYAYLADGSVPIVSNELP